MARIPRLRVANVPQHVVRRGNNRQAIFFAEDDRALYLRCLQAAARKHGCAINAYVLMTNHVHLLATPHDAQALSLMMRDLDRRYVQYINLLYQRTGTLWDGRFMNNLVESENYFFLCCRYIECNPVRAGMVRHPRDYLWSSYRCNAEGATDTVVTPHEEYDRLGSSPGARQRAYLALFAGDLTARSLTTIRRAVNRGWPIGSESFKGQVEKTLQCRVRPLKRGRRPSDTAQAE